METSTSKQAATHFSSHGEDDRSAGTWSGYRPDPQTARDKCFVANSDNRDQLQIATESENRSEVVSQQTRTHEGEPSATTASAGGATV